MDTLTLVATVAGSATIGAVIGKVLDAFVITPWSDRYERKRWLRQAKVEAYTRLTEELLSLGMVSGAVADPYKFRTMSAKAILLIDDPQVIADIEHIIQDIWHLSFDPSSVIKSNLPDDWTMTFPDGSIGTKQTFLRGVGMDQLEKEAFKVAEKLAADLKAT